MKNLPEAVQAGVGDRRNPGELPAMVATLCVVENQFGPYSPCTLRLMVEVGVTCFQNEQLLHARSFLERAVRDIEQYLGRQHEARLRALSCPRDVFVQQGDYDRAGGALKELLSCSRERLGPQHPETIVLQEELATLQWRSIDHVSKKV